ncbi:hydroxyethylthiazole kinase [Endozoicomonas sp.]|uniref:hydroxyethylthiazole kinase n=1 Tax=Endozoicomonas sp. TaxID=1892382 RepID=UPI003D9B6F82
MHKEIANCLLMLREQQPVVHNITNQVVMNNTANALLAIGASPIMAHAAEEVEEMVSLAGALVINTGTITSYQVSSMVLAIEKANELGKPWILDPVGAGATTFRLNMNRELLQLKPTVVRGNASEILSVLAGEASGKGVDSIHDSSSTLGTIQHSAAELGIVMAVTGAVDYVTDGKRLAAISNGHPMMAKVTGTGCSATAVTGAFLATCEDPWLASLSSLSCMGIAGEVAVEASKGPGSLQMHLLDQLFLLNESVIRNRLQLNLESY